ncbi:hypothetical protein JCM17845_01300 [Iodidimonas gelatinilytica]|uniref:Tetratricopeptide repeat protein n=1 Tax=Iodidimonas gelatinilytica TaxID=1236966 RepID=A0A5A7MUK3_9PROT|nr:tetratricopeptide repeat protein [Iodidimonas gelatinilytica]GEQ99506.1 hypothetical protein JCM17845_01300 [Iodidimonas gelatinilytica]
MKTKQTKMGLSLIAALAVVSAAAPGVPGGFSLLDIRSAQAQSDEKPKRSSKKVDSLRANVYEKIAKAQEKLEKGEKADAVKDLNSLLEDKINDYETAIVYQILASSVYIEEERYKEAITEYEKILKLERVPDSLQIASLNALAQLYLIDEQYENSITYMKRWMATQENPGPTPYYFMAQGYYGLEDYANIVPNILKAIELGRARGDEPKENWYLMLRLAYFELGNFEKVRDVLEYLTVNFEKPEYWRQLAAVYSELGQEDKQFATMEVAYRQGYLDKESQLINLAQLYLYHNVPIKSAWVIEKGMKDGIIEKNGENYELLGQAYLNAQEMRKAEEPLRLAAKDEDNGDIWMRLGQVYAEQERWKEAIEPLQKAVDSDDLDKPGYAHMMIGMAYFNTGKLEDAKKTFRQAAKFEETKKAAAKWIDYTGKEQERRAQLTEYYGGGGQ